MIQDSGNVPNGGTNANEHLQGPLSCLSAYHDFSHPPPPPLVRLSPAMAPKLRQHDPQEGAQPVNHASSAEPLINGATPHAARDPQKAESEETNPATSGPTSTDDDTMDAEDIQEDEHLRETGDSEAEEDDAEEPKESEPTSHGTKRKASNPEVTPHKSARHAPHLRSKSLEATTSKLSSADQIMLLNFLLSPSSLPFARPKDETEDLKSRPNGGAKTRTYAASPFTPFEEILNALILSRPIGHTLGLRSIRTLLNPPHNLMSPKLIRATGVDGVRQALDEARTQHRQKTAEQIVLLADAVTDTLGEDHFDVSLERVREECEHDKEKERAMLQKNIKGMGDVGLDIFGRRIQGLWREWYPFADQKTLDALKKLGLAEDTDDLKSMLEEHWKELIVDDVIGDGEERKRRVLVRVLERAVGAELEGSLDEMKAKALEWRR